jgi:hypothetical protein
MGLKLMTSAGETPSLSTATACETTATNWRLR